MPSIRLSITPGLELALHLKLASLLCRISQRRGICSALLVTSAPSPPHMKKWSVSPQGGYSEASIPCARPPCSRTATCAINGLITTFHSANRIWQSLRPPSFLQRHVDKGPPCRQPTTRARRGKLVASRPIIRSEERWQREI